MSVRVANRMSPMAPNSITMIPSMSGRRAGTTGATATTAATEMTRVRWSQGGQIRKMPSGPWAVTARAAKATAAATIRPLLATWTEMSTRTNATTSSVSCRTQRGIQRRRPPVVAGSAGPTVLGLPAVGAVGAAGVVGGTVPGAVPSLMVA